jgi:hypothetical protein
VGAKPVESAPLVLGPPVDVDPAVNQHMPCNISGRYLSVELSTTGETEIAGYSLEGALRGRR